MSGQLPTWRVLVVEDDRTVAKVHCRHISQRPGYRVVGVATTGWEAERLAKQTKPDLTLLDLALPGGHGISLLRELRGLGSSTEVIVVSGHSHPEVVRAAVQLGAMDYLVKPFWPERLTQALETFEERTAEFSAGRSLDQLAIDRLKGDLGGRPGSGEGLSDDRLRAVHATLIAAGEPLSADEVAVRIGVARVTVRRYLEHLVGLGRCAVEQSASGPGRPRKLYRLWLNEPIGKSAPRR